MTEPLVTKLDGKSMTRPAAIDFATTLRALADPSRLRIINILRADFEVRPLDLREPLKLSQPTITHHIRVLQAAGIVEVDRENRSRTLVRLAPGALRTIAGALTARQTR